MYAKFYLGYMNVKGKCRKKDLDYNDFNRNNINLK